MIALYTRIYYIHIYIYDIIYIYIYSISTYWSYLSLSTFRSPPPPAASLPQQRGPIMPAVRRLGDVLQAADAFVGHGQRGLPSLVLELQAIREGHHVGQPLAAPRVGIEVVPATQGHKLECR